MKRVAVLMLLAIDLQSCHNRKSSDELLAHNDAKKLAEAGPGHCLRFSNEIGSEKDIPLAPDSRLTPGSVCRDRLDTRYPEHIPYCDRNVENTEKAEIFDRYVRGRLLTDSYNRDDFKIDHFIPLCMGGNNDVANLWPQHRSIALVTDTIESRLCILMARGEMKQSEAFAAIRKAKLDINHAYDVCVSLDRRFR